jgi:hypothetical protein
MLAGLMGVVGVLMLAWWGGKGNWPAGCGEVGIPLVGFLRVNTLFCNAGALLGGQWQ